MSYFPGDWGMNNKKGGLLRVKCLLSLTPSCLRLLHSHGLQANVFCLVLHIDMLIIKEFCLWLYEKRKVYIVYRRFAETLRPRLTSTSKIFPNPCYCPDIYNGQSSFAPPISPFLDLKEAWNIYFLKINLRYHLGAHLFCWYLLDQ